jgi:hypothetical protein
MWEKGELPVARGASQLDLDAFGVDFGDGIPAAAFQIKKSDNDCCMDYAIYSLEKPPRLVHTLTGGEFFSASDLDLDGKIEIWSSDATVDGFENLTLSELDSAPVVVFRFEHGQLLDVGAEFQSFYDSQIAGIRAQLHPPDLQEFKSSDGKLAEIPTAASAERLHRLRVVKIEVLEIDWAYLYSGREQDAWRSLAEMWPAADMDRIRSAILNSRARGIQSQTDGASEVPAKGKKKHAQIFNAVSRPSAGHGFEVVPPSAILLELPPAPEIQRPTQPQPDLILDLVIDAAGKVRSAEAAGKLKCTDSDLMAAARAWKFIPAFKEGRPVAVCCELPYPQSNDVLGRQLLCGKISHKFLFANFSTLLRKSLWKTGPLLL